MTSSFNRPERGRCLTAPIAIAIAAAVLGGCVHQKAAGVRIASKESSISFGTATLAAAPPPGAAPVGAVPPSVNPVIPPTAAGSPGGDPVIPLPIPAPLPTLAPPQKGDLPFCRTAGINDFAAPATQRVSGPPKAGTYYYKRTPPQLLNAPKYDIGPDQLVRRVVSGVSPVTTSTNPVSGAAPPAGNGSGDALTKTFEYDLTTFQTNGVAVQDRYRVVDNPVTVAVTSGANVGPTTYGGQPDRGISLVHRYVLDGQGNRTAQFNPVTPVLLMPLPAIGGQAFQSVGLDPLGSTYVVYGNIIKRQTTDACGDVVDGWAVSAETAFKDPAQGGTVQSATLTLYFATGLGGLPVYEGVGPLASPPNPANGTPLDNNLSTPPALPASPIAAPTSELSLARRDPV